MSVEDLPPEVLTRALGNLNHEELVGTLGASKNLRASGTEALAAMPAPKKHRIKLVSGDDTGDGHGKSTDFTIMSNLDEEELGNAYNQGVKILNFDVASWSNFDAAPDCVLPPEACKKFEEHGFGLSSDDVDDDDDDDNGSGGGGGGGGGGGSSTKVRIDCFQRDLPMLWLFTAKLGAPWLEYNFTADRRIIIGGHSLFGD